MVHAVVSALLAIGRHVNETDDSSFDPMVLDQCIHVFKRLKVQSDMDRDTFNRKNKEIRK